MLLILVAGFGMDWDQSCLIHLAAFPTPAVVGGEGGSI
jgi:hypothetical protein